MEMQRAKAHILGDEGAVELAPVPEGVHRHHGGDLLRDAQEDGSGNQGVDQVLPAERPKGAFAHRDREEEAAFVTMA